MKAFAILVDDDESIIEVFKEVLEIIGVEIVGIGYNGSDAVELYKKFKPNLVFTDIMMPIKDGFYAIEKIREMNPEAKIIAVTADLSEETAEKLENMKISAVIHKPFDIEIVRRVLAEKLDFDIGFKK